MSPQFAEHFLIGWLVASALVVMTRGVVGSVREYDALDVALAPLEIGFLIWVLTQVSA